ncbi:hypothetical protein [Photobacterium sp. Hal280]|uniref:hypothetical protein n=1 Tax=Photobacterium sp. Hal280 TaxID=3035163 RepID=UPI00301D272C
MIKRTIATILLVFSGFCLGGAVQEGKEESQELMDAVLPLAERLLSEYGEFFPYGGAMTPEGKIISVAAYGGDEHPASSEVIDMLHKAFHTAAKNKEYKATALVYDVRVQLANGKPSDALAIELDHESGYSIVVMLPYILSNGQLQYGEISAQAGEGNVFK